jgi:hypothetical protein
LIVGRQQLVSTERERERERTLRIYPSNVKALDMKQLEKLQVGQLRSFYSCCTIPVIVNDWLMLNTIIGKESDRRYIEHLSQLSL